MEGFAAINSSFNRWKNRFLFIFCFRHPFTLMMVIVQSLNISHFSIDFLVSLFIFAFLDHFIHAPVVCFFIGVVIQGHDLLYSSIVIQTFSLSTAFCFFMLNSFLCTIVRNVNVNFISKISISLLRRSKSLLYNF